MKTVDIPQDALELLPDDGRRMIQMEGTQVALQLDGLKVTNKETYEKAVAVGIQNSKVLKGIENFEKAIVKPLKDQVKKIVEMFDKIKKPFEQNDTFIRESIKPYQDARKSFDKPAQEGGMKTVQAEGGRATVSKVMKYEVVDASLVPREWLCVDEVKVGRAVRGRVVSEIPGIKIWETSETSFGGN